MLHRKKYILSVLLAILLIVPIVLLAIHIVKEFNNSIGAAEIEEYCINKSTIDAAQFKRFGYSGTPNYAFWVSEYTGSEQELFVFIKKTICGIDLNRFSLVIAATSNPESDVGSIKFTPRSENGEKRDTSLLIYFSSNPNQISRYHVTYLKDGDIFEQDESISIDQAFVICIPDLGISASTSKKIQNVKFYDVDENIIFEESY